MSEELLPCPFCGTRFPETKGHNNSHVRCAAQCQGVFWTHREVWNRRFPLSTQPETEPAPKSPIPADAATPTSLFTAMGRICELERELAQALKQRDEAHCRNLFLEEFTPKTNLGLIETIDSLRAQLASVTQERDNLAAAYAYADAELAKRESDDPDHNPDNLSPEQYGAADGWRLLKRSEIVQFSSIYLEEIEAFESIHGVQKWVCDYIGNSYGVTYRTRLSPAELAALRAKGSE